MPKRLAGQNLIKYLVNEFKCGRITTDYLIERMHDKSITKSELWVYIVQNAIDTRKFEYKLKELQDKKNGEKK